MDCISLPGRALCCGREENIDTLSEPRHPPMQNRPRRANRRAQSPKDSFDGGPMLSCGRTRARTSRQPLRRPRAPPASRAEAKCLPSVRARTPPPSRCGCQVRKSSSSPRRLPALSLSLCLPLSISPCSQLPRAPRLHEARSDEKALTNENGFECSNRFDITARLPPSTPPPPPPAVGALVNGWRRRLRRRPACSARSGGRCSCSVTGENGRVNTCSTILCVTIYLNKQ